VTAIRRSAAAGFFYPDDAHELRNEIERLLHEARLVDGVAPQAMIQPHAGFRFSGPVAATGYRRLRHTRPKVESVVVLGPSHTVALDSIAVSGADEWETPLGRIHVADEMRHEVVGLDLVHVADRPHLTEHAIEVQLPFLQQVLDSGWSLLPIVVGDCKPSTTARVIDACASPDTLILVSSDLSHYHSYAEARRIDEITIEEVVARTVTAIGPRQACGYAPMRGLLSAAMTRDLAIEVLDMRNSADTAGHGHRVVGYASIVFG